jgi:hypothetical protein
VTAYRLNQSVVKLALERGSNIHLLGIKAPTPNLCDVGNNMTQAIRPSKLISSIQASMGCHQVVHRAHLSFASSSA